MSHDPNEGPARARAQFARAAERVDPATAGRLHAARRLAQQPRAAPPAWRFAVPVGAAAALAFAFAIGIPSPVSSPGDTTVAVAPVPDEAAAPALDPALPDEVERLLDAEDPDIYAWLADAPVATTSGVVP